MVDGCPGLISRLPFGFSTSISAARSPVTMKNTVRIAKNIPFILVSSSRPNVVGLGVFTVPADHRRLSLLCCWMTILATHSRRCIQDRLLNLVVTAAAAQITGQVSANLFHRWCWIFLQKAFGTQNKSRRAIGALKSIMIDKSLLNRMERAGITESLDG